MSEENDFACCRGCRRRLDGWAYYKGGSAYLPGTNSRVKSNFYGGWVCSKSCDYRASLEQEQSMPGHGAGQKTLGSIAQQHHDNNWREVTR